MWQVLGLPTPPPSVPSAQALVRQEREQARLAKRVAATADRARRSTQRTPAASQNASKEPSLQRDISLVVGAGDGGDVVLGAGSSTSAAGTGGDVVQSGHVLEANGGTPLHAATLNRPMETVVDSFEHQTTVHMTALFAFATVTMATLCMLLLMILGLLCYILPRLLQKRALRQRGANAPSAVRRLYTRLSAIAGAFPLSCPFFSACYQLAYMPLDNACFTCMRVGHFLPSAGRGRGPR